MRLWVVVIGVILFPAHAQVPVGSKSDPAGYFGAKVASATPAITSEAARELEARLQGHPDDVSARRQLIAYYATVKMPEPRTRHILWLIEHYPEADQAGESSAAVVPDANDPAPDLNDYRRVAGAWRQAVAARPKDTRVLGNAAAFYATNGVSGVEAEQLLLKAKELEPANGMWLRSLTKLYMDTIFRDSGDPKYQARNSDPAFNARARDVMENSTRLNSVMCWGCHMAAPHATESDFMVKGAHTSLAKVGGFVNPEAVKKPASPPLPPRSDGIPYAQPELISKVEPVYPLKAKTAGVSGSVTLELIIGIDGKVETAAVLRGHPVFTSAAIDAARQYVYKPTLVNGKPAKVVTKLDVLFQWVE